MAALPKGAKITRNAVAVAVLQEALAALEEHNRSKPVEGGGSPS